MTAAERTLTAAVPRRHAIAITNDSARIASPAAAKYIRRNGRGARRGPRRQFDCKFGRGQRCRRGHRPDLGDEPVSSARDRLDEPRLRRGIIEGEPDLVDSDVEAVIGVDQRVLGPQEPVQVIPGHQATGARDQGVEHACRLFLESGDRHSAADHFTGVGIEAVILESDAPISGRHSFHLARAAILSLRLAMARSL